MTDQYRDSTNELEGQVDESRRDLLKKALAGATVYSLPLLTSFSMEGLNISGEAFAQVANVGNQQVGVPTLNVWGLGGMIAIFGGLLAWFKRRPD